ncbi:MAG: GHKL domain-containing protein [Candidatus Ventricola sp.]
MRILSFAISPLLMAVGQMLVVLFFLHDRDEDCAVSIGLRAALALGLLAMNTAIQTFLRVSISENPLAPILTYLMMSLGIYALFVHLFSRGTWKESLFIGLIFLAADNSAWSLINSVSRILWNENFLYTGAPAQRLLAVLALWAVELSILMLVKRYLPRRGCLFLSNQTLLLIVLAAIPFLTVRWFSSQLPAQHTKTFQFVITVCFLSQLVLLVSYVGRESAERERFAQLQMQRVLQAQQQQFDMKIQSIEAVNRKYHDMKNLLIYLENGKGETTQVRQLMEDVKPFEALIATGNEAVNIILSEKLRLCQQEDICCVPYVDGALLAFISPLDVCTLLGNALDNAIESCRTIPEAENRQISIKTNRRGGYVVLVLRNTFGVEPQIRDGRPVSIKPDKENHGFGLRSIRYVAKKYGGEVSCRLEGQEFVLTMLFPEGTETKQASDAGQ